MTVLVTGAAGVLGQALLHALGGSIETIGLVHTTPVPDPRVPTIRGAPKKCMPCAVRSPAGAGSGSAPKYPPVPVCRIPSCERTGGQDEPWADPAWQDVGVIT